MCNGWEAAANPSGAAFDQVDAESIGSELEAKGALCMSRKAAKQRVRGASQIMAQAQDDGTMLRSGLGSGEAHDGRRGEDGDAVGGPLFFLPGV